MRLAKALATVRSRYGSRIASVVHLAAYYDFTGEPNQLYDAVKVQGTERLLQALRDFEVGQFMFSSTMLVHAPTEPGRTINEASPIEPKWAYPKSKDEDENLLRTHHGKSRRAPPNCRHLHDKCDSTPLAHQIQRIYQPT